MFFIYIFIYFLKYFLIILYLLYLISFKLLFIQARAQDGGLLNNSFAVPLHSRNCAILGYFAMELNICR